MKARADRAVHARTDTALHIDFVGGALGHRLRFGGGRGQALARAAGLVRGATPTIVDATAGLGRDAFVLASLGAQVTMIERSAAVHAALADALQRARAAAGEAADIAARIVLHHGDARALLPGMDADVVMVDPMHPPRGNSALVKQEMRLLRELVGTDPDSAELLGIALACARHRVVLKWPLRAPLLPGMGAPSHQIVGKTVRYDVFMVGLT